MSALLEIDGLSREFITGNPLRRSKTLAVDDVSLTLAHGEALALVGESGSGKTTIGRIVVGLLSPTAGQVRVDGRDIANLKGADKLAFKRDVQMVFQNTQNAFNPRRRVVEILSDPFRIHGIAKGSDLRERAEELFRQVGLDPAMLTRFPHEFSGGQRQRISIARALALQPRMLVADEPVSALDVSVQAQVLNLLARLRSEQRMGMLFVSHDMRAVSFLCDRIAVLYQGRLVELGSRDEVLARPAHPYTKILIDSVPTFGSGARRLESAELIGELEDRPSQVGCNFRDRCPLRRELGNPLVCEQVRPELVARSGGQSAACHFADAAPPAAIDTTPEQAVPAPAGVKGRGIG